MDNPRLAIKNINFNSFVKLNIEKQFGVISRSKNSLNVSPSNTVEVALTKIRFLVNQNRRPGKSDLVDNRAHIQDLRAKWINVISGLSIYCFLRATGR